jgi:hypothetical protein
MTGRYIWATTAEHSLGDISRDEGDIAMVTHADETHHVGHWLTGFGFINVRFPKATSRELSWVELDWLSARAVVGA